MTDHTENTWISVDSQQAFVSCCERWESVSALAVDTEFMRTNTFYPRLGLLQVADGNAVYLVDPLGIEDWTPFKYLLTDPNRIIVMHSAGEDLTVFQTTFDEIPRNLFDTQIAAAYLDKGFSLSYQALVKEIMGVEIPKDETRSDWLQRPLSESQQRYAALDVEYLLEIRERLSHALRSQSMYQCFEEDSQQVLTTAIAQEEKSNWERYYEKISNAWRLNQRELELLQQLCYWRELEARRRNKPRNWIAKDADLFEIAQVFAADQDLAYENWRLVKAVNQGFIKHNGERLIAIFRQPITTSTASNTSLPPPLPSNQRNMLKKLRELVVARAEELGIAPELLARKRWITDLLQNSLAGTENTWPESLRGWRQEILEPDFSAVLNELSSNGSVK